MCDATLGHEVSVFVEQATTPPATPTLLETIAVPGGPSGGDERHVFVGLAMPVTLHAGDQLYIAMRNAGTYPDVTCWQLCEDPAHHAENQTWWNNADAPPFPWGTLASFGIDGTVNAFALGHP